MSTKRIAVVGAGVNGVSIATACASLGHQVQLFDESTPFDQTSSASSRMLHGGIRYIEQGHIGLVREALIERMAGYSLPPMQPVSSGSISRYTKGGNGADGYCSPVH